MPVSLNSCHNHPFDGRHRTPVVNNGYTEDGRLKTVEWPVQWSPSQCVHGGHPDTDPMCEGCRWRPPVGATQEEIDKHEQAVILALNANGTGPGPEGNG
ncbi:hypothetical protein [Thioalkalivibrio sp. ALE16]|uniref:hypothetical protein n=1 Tax=Thioalkalivibrio sp. ALE16 TaxID=1158172 RepID=UPI00035EB13F|nr:hypothetical protein [Thioalkalivibrio sp. ALE16]